MSFAAEPTALQLITIFLDKAGCIEGGQVCVLVHENCGSFPTIM